MTKKEAIKNLYGLINDINANEIADHIKTDSLQSWTATWRNTAKEVMQKLDTNCTE